MLLCVSVDNSFFGCGTAVCNSVNGPYKERTWHDLFIYKCYFFYLKQFSVITILMQIMLCFFPAFHTEGFLRHICINFHHEAHVHFKMAKSAGATSILHAVRWRIWWSGGKVSTHCEFRHTCTCLYTRRAAYPSTAFKLCHAITQNSHLTLHVCLWACLYYNHKQLMELSVKVSLKSSKRYRKVIFKLCGWTRESTLRLLSKHLTEFRPADLTSVFSAVLLAARSTWNASVSRNCSKAEILKVFPWFTDTSMLDFVHRATANKVL